MRSTILKSSLREMLVYSAFPGVLKHAPSLSIADGNGVCKANNSHFYWPCAEKPWTALFRASLGIRIFTTNGYPSQNNPTGIPGSLWV